MKIGHVDPTLLAASAALCSALFAYGTMKIFTSQQAGRGARIAVGVIGGLLIGAAVYVAFTDIIGAAVGAGLLLVLWSYSRLTKPRSDFVVQDSLLDEAISPELNAQLEILGAAAETGRELPSPESEEPNSVRLDA